jgi:hypothetical protein
LVCSTICVQNKNSMVGIWRRRYEDGTFALCKHGVRLLWTPLCESEREISIVWQTIRQCGMGRDIVHAVRLHSVLFLRRVVDVRSGFVVWSYWLLAMPNHLPPYSVCSMSFCSFSEKRSTRDMPTKRGVQRTKQKANNSGEESTSR